MKFRTQYEIDRQIFIRSTCNNNTTIYKNIQDTALDMYIRNVQQKIHIYKMKATLSLDLFLFCVKRH
jgi:hypothetical protein